ncbi:MAG: hypothetical protein M3N13_05510 [Candidatus Eremiobacteraeota bacterium]|nr:hypothetical protein [Candidatus Eremiobacteraeota bacterium]
MRRELHGAPDYEGSVKAAFDDLLIRIVRFVSMRLEAARSRYPYLNKISASNGPKEIDLQNDLFDYLGSTGYTAWERDNVASGRTDIVVPMGPFSFVIETKQDDAQWHEGSSAVFVAQATAYQQTDVRLGILAVLDLSVRRPGDPHLDGCFSVKTDRYSMSDERTVVLVRVPGNKRTPSDQ